MDPVRLSQNILGVQFGGQSHLVRSYLDHMGKSLIISHIHEHLLMRSNQSAQYFGTWWSFHSTKNHIIQILSKIYTQTTCLLFHWWIDTVNIINQLVWVVELKLNKYIKYLVHILNSKKNISHSNASLTSKRAFQRHESTDAGNIIFFLDRRRHPILAWRQTPNLPSEFEVIVNGGGV